ncbi:sigma-70 family RNA polymerase sigma factor [Streptomyces sp. NPDC051105]|uniref:sigma-70 family RNA polymerase sigma factor n=1 Tax=Streptomyces sp. NPDC051105 TaxID=3154843 RepID=UPI00342E022D
MPDTETITAAQDGDQHALDQLVAGSLPFVYNVVGRALGGHLDVDDVVQDTMISVVAGLDGLREAELFRSWLVAIAMQKVRERWRVQQNRPAPGFLDEVLEAQDPSADFVEATILQLGLSGQRREVTEATRWLDPAERELLSVWWLEASGQFTRAELAAALELTPQHTAVRVQRLRERLESARIVVRALGAVSRCPDLGQLTEGWDGVPAGLWRKRIARHVRACATCGTLGQDLVPAERLLAGLALVPVSAGLGTTALLYQLGAAHTAAATGAAAPHAVGLAGTRLADVVHYLMAKPAVAITAGAVVVSGGALTGYAVLQSPPPRHHAVATTPTPAHASPATAGPTTIPNGSAIPSTPVYGQNIDHAESAPNPDTPPGELPMRPQTAPVAMSGTYGSRHPGATGEMYVLNHRGDNLRISGRGYFFVRWQVTVFPGSIAMPTWTGLTGKLFHVASGGGRRMDDLQPGTTDEHTWLGNRPLGYATLPAGAQQMWQNEYYYVDGTVTLNLNQSGLKYALIVASCSRQHINDEIRQAPADDPALGYVRYGIVRDTGDDGAPVPQYLTRSAPADPFAVPQLSRLP